MTNETPLLSVDGITAGYGKIDILQDVSLTISPGEIVSVIGPNGAGKSTAFKGPGRALLEDPEVKAALSGRLIQSPSLASILRPEDREARQRITRQRIV